MTPAKQLRVAFENCELQHPLFLQHLKPLRRRIEDALDGAASRVERVMGPSRVGKSMLINTLRREFPETKQDGRRRVPVLVVPVSTPASPVQLPIDVLIALGLPVQRKGSGTDMRIRMDDQLKLAGTRVLIFEEASHLVEPGTRVIPRSAGDWFKSLTDKPNLTLFLLAMSPLPVERRSENAVCKYSSAYSEAGDETA